MLNLLSGEKLCALILVGLFYAESSCPITDDIRIVYSLVNGVGPASKIWVEDFLWWWQAYDPSVRYLGMTAEDMQACDFASYPNLKVYINPGGNAYDQLTALGTKGTSNIRNFVTRDQSISTSAYVGFCAGGYIASHDYLWETIYEGPGYYNYAENPPISLFPHTVEGSIVDINDDQYADQQGSKFRAVNGELFCFLILRARKLCFTIFFYLRFSKSFERTHHALLWRLNIRVERCFCLRGQDEC